MLLKKVPFDYVPVNLLKGEHRGDEFRKINPAGLVPVLVTPQGDKLVQSLAILQYLEDLYSAPALFGKSPEEGVRIRALCEIINSDTAPLQSPRVQKRHSLDSADQALWAQEWIRIGLRSFDQQRKKGDAFAFGKTLSAADLVLVPQVYNAIRYKVDVADEFPELMRIYDHCLATDEGQRAAPDQQSDAHPA